MRVLRTLPLRDLALAVLLLAVSVNRYTIAIAGLHAKLEHIAVVPALGVAAWAWWRGGRPGDWRPLGWIPLFLGLMALASALNSPAPLTSLRYTLLIGLVAAGAVAVYRLADTPARFTTAVRLLIALGVLEAAVAFAALTAAAFGGTFGTQPGFIGTRVVYGTLWEPNVLGSYLAAASTLTLALLLAARDRRRAVGLAGGLALMLAALGLSSTRAAWLGFLAGAMVVLIGACVQRAPAAGLSLRTAGLAAVAAVLALGFVVGAAPRLFPNASLGLTSRVNLDNYDPQTDPSLQTRATSTSQALAGIAQHPIVGNGAGSYGLAHADAQGAPGWLSNLELHLLYDSGALGLLALLGGWAFLGGRAASALRRPAPAAGDLRPAILGLLGASVVLLVAYQGTEATWLGYTWIYLGLLARAGAQT